MVFFGIKLLARLSKNQLLAQRRDQNAARTCEESGHNEPRPPKQALLFMLVSTAL